ncbi:MAG: alpha/beta fold hydrolase [Desulfobacterales bacterium]|nr:alpha/beta fold hydrolase [Desulfobacterales bacterium]
MEERSVDVVCSDGYSISTQLYDPRADMSRGGLILANALGVPQGFYRATARYFSGLGFRVTTFDYRGTGASLAGDPSTLRLEDWGLKDLDAVIARAQERDEKVFVMGHSVGGQLCPLAPRSRDLSGLVLVGASFPLWSRWTFPRNLYMLFFWYGLLPALALGRSHFPTRMLGLSKEDMPVGFIRQWGKWARRDGYVTSPDLGIDISGFEAFQAPVLSWGFDDDTYAPKANIQRLHQALPHSDIQLRFMAGRKIHGSGMGHFGFYRKARARKLWDETAQWLSGC